MTTAADRPPAPGAIVVGVSAGAVEALSALLPALPAGYPLPVLVVVHIPPDRSSVLAELFRAKCRVAVKEAEDKEPIAGGTVYFAPPDYHLLVEPDGRLSLSSEEPVLFSRPSADVLFESAADAFGPAVVGVVLTGASADGARGLKAVCAAGGTAVVQHPAGAYAAEMPRAALAACPVASAMTLDQIAAYLARLGGTP
ncbi:MAG TPA: chemotaxis protein CheB [Urbifossiella sp.]|nr:chemotaxis protein CheB [Urbifossiella sp.]